MNNIKCPDCKRANKTDVTDGKITCRSCRQTIIIKDSQGIKCFPASFK